MHAYTDGSEIEVGDIVDFDGTTGIVSNVSGSQIEILIPDQILDKFMIRGKSWTGNLVAGSFKQAWPENLKKLKGA